MKGYLICFIFTLLFAILAEYALKSNRKRIGIFLLGISLVVPCFIAGARAVTVGKDVQSYFLVAFKGFLNGDNFFEVTNRANIEYGYSLLLFFSGFFKNVNFSLFMSEFAVCLPIYLFAYKNRNKYSITFTILIFLLTLYCISLNLLRQSIAIAIIIYALSLYEHKEYKKSWITFFIAFLFHYSSIVCLLMISIYHICFKCKKNRRVYLFIMLLGIATLAIGFEKLLVLFPNKYTYYIGSSYDISSFSIMSIVKKVYWIIPCFMYLSRYKKKQDEEYSYALVYTIFFIIDFILYFMSIKLSSAGRLGSYFLYAGYFFFIPKFKEIFKEKIIINCIIIASLCFFWYNMTIVNNEVNGTYPYISSTIKVLND